MGSFVDPKATVDIVEFDPTIVISDVTPRVITIRVKMDYQTTKHVQGVAVRMGKDGKDTEFDLGSSLMELLVVNIKAWRGGDLEGVPCDAAHIRMLDPTDPFIQRVADEIGERNKQKPSPNPQSVENNGSTSNGAYESATQETSPMLSLVSTKSSTPLQSAIIGHRAKSENSTPDS